MAKVIGVMGFGYYVLKEPVYGQGSSSGDSSTCDLTTDNSAVAWDSEYELQYYTCGYSAENGVFSNRSFIVFLLKFLQTDTQFVEKVVFTDSDKNVLAARYFQSTDKIKGSTFPPYLIFDNLDLNSSNQYFLYIQVRTGPTSTSKFRQTFTKESLAIPIFTGAQLPASLKQDLNNSHGSIVSTPIVYRNSMTKDVFARHFLKAEFLQLNSNDYFQLRIQFMHADQSAAHFMRYFIVTDPVGRILGLLKRTYGDVFTQEVIVSSLTEDERNQWGITKDNVAKITDCPYVMIFLDDVAEILTRMIIWLR